MSPAAQDLFRQLYYVSAPVMEQIKPAVLYNLKGECAGHWDALTQKPLPQGIQAFELYRVPGLISLLLYREDLLTKALRSPQAAAFLQSYGYQPGLPLCGQLHYLKSRYHIREYPHEIGVFLGYPLSDVMGFIRNRGQNYKLCRYWKVYGDVRHSRRLFEQIDLARTRAMQELEGVQF